MLKAILPAVIPFAAITLLYIFILTANVAFITFVAGMTYKLLF